MWDAFSKIYCLNLKSRPDRRQRCDQIFTDLKIPVEYYHPDKHPTSGEQGCFESHIEVISRAYDAGAETCLIFEDDIEPYEFSEERLNQAVRFMTEHKDWDLCFLGLCWETMFHSAGKTKWPGIYHGSGGQLSRLCRLSSDDGESLPNEILWDGH